MTEISPFDELNKLYNNIEHINTKRHDNLKLACNSFLRWFADNLAKINHRTGLAREGKTYLTVGPIGEKHVGKDFVVYGYTPLELYDELVKRTGNNNKIGPFGVKILDDGNTFLVSM